ncbi:conjugal transfer protein TraF [Halocella sp. SP3-1]|uniref:conjugal transfer protein TraF n=1 Tax=Halocella sp. SP3-1 TaxID=2382161 RepID=UPI000F7647C3|nr:conjugal transfer protein TraF [Halocella sp. SP3-1]AZO93985.1 hypothetical protein D7D81_04940 [Halocella sp. SP3-1]
MKLKVVLVVSLVVILVSAGSVGAVKLDSANLTARSLGMGGAFTGLADDLSSLYYNPAGMVDSGLLGIQLDLGTMVSVSDELDELQDIPDKINDDSISDALSVIPDDVNFMGQGQLAANFKSFGVAYTNKAFAESSNQGSSASADLFNLQEGVLSLGNELIGLPFGVGRLVYGMNYRLIKLEKESYAVSSATEVTKIESDDDSFAIDLGLLMNMTDNFRVGLQIQNLIKPDFDLSGDKEESHYDGSTWVIDSDSYSEEMKLDRVGRIGASLRVPIIDLTLAADIDNLGFLSDTKDDEVYHFGIEKDIIFNGLSLRAGTFSQEDGDNYLTCGLGLNLKALHLDIAAASDDRFDKSVAAVVSGRVKF